MESQSLINFFYSLTLTLHNISRWLVVGFGVWAIVRAFGGWFGKRDWVKLDDRAGLAFTSIIDLQLIFGLVLYFLFSPYSRIAFQNFGAAMTDRVTRFFALEHFLMMGIAMIVAHVGRALAKKAGSDLAKHKRAAIWSTVTLVIILASVPWPFMNLGRPWFRLFGISF